MGKRIALYGALLGATFACHAEPPVRTKPDAPTANIPVLKPGCRGKLSDALVEELHARARATRNCYEVTVGSNPRLGGRLTIQFDVNPSGSVSRAALSLDELRNPELSSCVLAIFEKPYQSPPELECVTVGVPINFTPKP